jgi:DNA-binding LacI/PurR family transcriptional regulator
MLQAIRALGLDVPGDLAVIGFDECEFAELAIPRLTTVRADAEGHGRAVARRTLGLDMADIETRLGRVIERDSV